MRHQHGSNSILIRALMLKAFPGIRLGVVNSFVFRAPKGHLGGPSAAQKASGSLKAPFEVGALRSATGTQRTNLRGAPKLAEYCFAVLNRPG